MDGGLERRRRGSIPRCYKLETRILLSGFNDADVGVVRDNTKQLKFNPRSTGFSD